jgi:CubicO group peptidase (beta-lactamase class C family)
VVQASGSILLTVRPLLAGTTGNRRAAPSRGATREETHPEDTAGAVVLRERAGGGYSLGFGVTSEPKYLKERGSVGSYYWGGFYYTAFEIDPKEDLIAIFMGQLHPAGGLNLAEKVKRLAYQAIKD